MDISTLPAAGIALIVLLTACFVALVGLVATLPPVTGWVRRALNIGAALPPAGAVGKHP
jgi:hypothetical protein